MYSKFVDNSFEQEKNIKNAKIRGENFQMNSFNDSLKTLIQKLSKT